MEKIPTSKYDNAHSEFTAEIERGNLSYHNKLEKIKLGKSIYAFSKNVSKLILRTLPDILKLTIAILASAIKTYLTPTIELSPKN